MSPQSADGPAARIVRATRVAFSLLTVFPISVGNLSERELAESRWAFPIVGVALGLVLALLSQALGRLEASANLSAFMLVAAAVGISGGLHLDGLADTADGLFLGGTAERRLAAMRDPHIGSFGVAAIVLTLLGRFAALGQFAPTSRARAIFTAVFVGRTLLLVAAGLGRYAREQGTGRMIIEAATSHDAQIASLVLLLVVTALLGPAGALAGLSALGLAFLLCRSSQGRLGGITGDILGAVAELGELVFLLVLALLKGHG